MKKIAAVFSFAVGLLCLFSDNAQAQRARWSGNAANGFYNFVINLDTKEDGIASGIYPNAVELFEYQVPNNGDPNNPDDSIFLKQYQGQNLSSKLGELILKKYDENQDNIDDTIEIFMNFDDNSLIKSSTLIIKPNPNRIDFDGNFNDVDVNNLSLFYGKLSELNQLSPGYESSILIDTSSSKIIFAERVLKSGVGDRDSFQSPIGSITIEKPSSVSVPEPNLGYSSIFLIPFAISLRKLKRLKGAKMIPNQIMSGN
ncbi:hypothetical protein NIES37_42920 [Tolypothrix tenuis PCC 7101]|uniref:PEP-CTERM sorting domain-containing protein n=1 Tax=Tolypothrix tenuis PCC 7101 TaxID=231146 RepID=A0A1Z4N3H5_9CYAN|nr:hypothetical protein [Aulosira sp. FACHB-113]BAZ00303.1 hypothetical protein NIES37_42920 [Tolypothrix tenuis PCC 7101]BAZ75776.1 hypothetical protein NIES50_43670 [Aulosira laxa NIES-50]